MNDKAYLYEAKESYWVHIVISVYICYIAIHVLTYSGCKVEIFFPLWRHETLRYAASLCKCYMIIITSYTHTHSFSQMVHYFFSKSGVMLQISPQMLAFRFFKSLRLLTYTFSFKYPYKEKSKEVKSVDRSVQGTSPRRKINRFGSVLRS